MGLFDKKYCDICGEKIGLLGNRKLDDGNLCKECARKLSPWFEERRHSTVEAIKEQLAYREANKEKVQAFRITRELKSDSYSVFIDEEKGQFAIGRNMTVEENPDIVDLSQVVSCRLDVDEHRKELYYTDDEGERQSFRPPRYEYSYDYRMYIKIQSPWFDDMDFKLNSFSVEAQKRHENMKWEMMGRDITEALTRNASRRQQQSAMPERVGPVNTDQTWTCSCGAVNTGKFCQECGSPKPMNNKRIVRCDKCGWTPPDPNKIPKFCPECGDPFNADDIQ